MQGRILLPTDLGKESGSVFPWAVTIAQAFPHKLYLLHVMHPESVNKPERLEDFPSLTDFFAKDRENGFTPPLKSTVPVAKMYIYNEDVSKVIIGTARTRQVDLICLAAIRAGANFAWWSAGKTVETVIEKAPCSVLCVRGRVLKEADWTRPRFRHLLFLTESNTAGPAHMAKVMPWVERFNSMLHIFPLGDLKQKQEQDALNSLCQNHESQTHILKFDKPRQRTENLLKFIADTPVDLIIMTPRTRAKFSNRLISDIFVRLLKATDVPVLLLR